MAILMDVSRNINENNPNTIAAETPMPKLPALGNRHITSTAINAPTNKYGMRRPKRHQVLSLKAPIIGWTTMPAKGGRIQK